jgi:hypothetical protein
MTTTQNYNPIFRAFHELTTPEAFRWYGTQARATATLAQTIAFRSVTAAQRLLSNRHRFAIAPAVAEPENAKAPHPAVQDDGDAVAVSENAIAPQQEYASTEATEAQDLPVPDGWEAIEANDTAVAEPEQADAGWEAKATRQEYAPSETVTIAPAIEPELNDSECDRIAIDELEQAIAGEAEPELAWVDEALLDDEDPTERRYWSGEDAEVVESSVMSHQGEDDAEDEAGDKA